MSAYAAGHQHAFEVHLLARQGSFDVGTRTLVIIFADHVADVATENLRRRDPEPTLIGLVIETIALIGIDISDQDRHVIRDGAQPALAAAQGHFGLLELGNVLTRTAITGEVTPDIEHRPPIHPHVTPATVPIQALQDQVVKLLPGFQHGSVLGPVVPAHAEGGHLPAGLADV